MSSVKENYTDFIEIKKTWYDLVCEIINKLVKDDINTKMPMARNMIMAGVYKCI